MKSSEASALYDSIVLANAKDRVSRDILTTLRDNAWDGLRKTASKEFAGRYLGEGMYRVAYWLDDEWIIKIPRYAQGAVANMREAAQFAAPTYTNGWPLAETYLNLWNDLPVVIQERLESPTRENGWWRDPRSKIPQVEFVGDSRPADGYQYGFSKKQQRSVLYDFAEYIQGDEEVSGERDKPLFEVGAIFPIAEQLDKFNALVAKVNDEILAKEAAK